MPLTTKLRGAWLACALCLLAAGALANPDPRETLDPERYATPTPEAERYFVEAQEPETGESVIYDKIAFTSNTIRIEEDLLWFDLTHQTLSISGPADKHARIRIAGRPGSASYMKAGLLAVGDNDEPTSCFAVLAHSLESYGVYGYGDVYGLVGRSGAGYGLYVHGKGYVQGALYCDEVITHSWAWDGSTTGAVAALASVAPRDGTQELDHNALSGVLRHDAVVPLRVVGGYGDFAKQVGTDDEVVGAVSKMVDPATGEIVTSGEVIRSGLSMSRVLMLLAPVVVEQQARIESLEARIVALEIEGGIAK